MDYKVFYSWQSDLPNRTNRGLVSEALEAAALAVRKDETIEIQPAIDRDTLGEAGSPEIASTIFKKIEAAQAVVADVSIINQGAGRPAPNPNVLLELGYAARHLGWERLVMVFNLAFGRMEDLPFDLRTRRVISYTSSEADADRASSRKQLASTLEAALRSIIDKSGVVVGEPITGSPPVNLGAEVLDCVFGSRHTHLTSAFSSWIGFVKLRLWARADATAIQDMEILLSDPYDSQRLCSVGPGRNEEENWPVEVLGASRNPLAIPTGGTLPLGPKSQPLEGWLCFGVPSPSDWAMATNPLAPSVSSKLVIRLREIGGFTGWRVTVKFAAIVELQEQEAPFERRLHSPMRFIPRETVEIAIDNDW
ncbi:MAG TPA: hypothetical protein VHE55_06030 [Fimbriimonadaceae bacterium]|nr:hypothetical protein [Fimbriimonadaceae bacterium]